MTSKKKDSIERLKEKLSQYELNLKLATESQDKCEIKNWQKQIRIQKAVLKRVQELESKKSGKP